MEHAFLQSVFMCGNWERDPFDIFNQNAITFYKIKNKTLLTGMSRVDIILLYYVWQ